MTMTTMTTMKPQALIEPDAIQPARNAIDVIQPEPGATRLEQNVIGAIELEPNTPVVERELARDSDAVVAPLRSNCLHRAQAFHDCAGIALGQTFSAESVGPTTSIARVNAVGKSQAACHLRALQVAKHGSAYLDCKTMLAAPENSGMADYPAGSRAPANCDFGRSQPANSTAQCASCFVDSEPARWGHRALPPTYPRASSPSLGNDRSL
jgi:hypothetical protein